MGNAVRCLRAHLTPLAQVNTMNRVKEVERINVKDLQLQLASDTVGNAGQWDVNKSWHAQYKDSAYVYVGGLSDGLSEGDVIVICSQFGEVVDINMPRDKKTGKTKGFAFICYEVRADSACLTTSPAVIEFVRAVPHRTREAPCSQWTTSTEPKCSAGPSVAIIARTITRSRRKTQPTCQTT